MTPTRMWSASTNFNFRQCGHWGFLIYRPKTKENLSDFHLNGMGCPMKHHINSIWLCPWPMKSSTTNAVTSDLIWCSSVHIFHLNPYVSTQHIVQCHPALPLVDLPLWNFLVHVLTCRLIPLFTSLPQINTNLNQTPATRVLFHQTPWTRFCVDVATAKLPSCWRRGRSCGLMPRVA